MEISLPTISIVLFVRNGARYVQEAIESVIRQDYPNYELIIIDGKSTDTTLEIVNKFKNSCTKIISENDKGIYHACNKGIFHASGDFLYFLAADDFLYPGSLKKVGEFLKQNPETDLLYGEATQVDADGNLICKHGAIPYSKERLINVRDYIPTQATFIRRGALSYTGIFDTSLHWCGDWDLWKRFAVRDMNIVFLNELIGGWRLHKETITGTAGSSRTMLLQCGESFLNARKYSTHCISRIEITLLPYLFVGLFGLREPLRGIRSFIRKRS